jgi:hypothetical protein
MLLDCAKLYEAKERVNEAETLYDKAMEFYEMHESSLIADDLFHFTVKRIEQAAKFYTKIHKL